MKFDSTLEEGFRMTKDDAMREIVWDARSERRTYTSFKRVMRALKALDLNAAEQAKALAHLGYVRHDTLEPFPWLAEKMGAKTAAQT